MIDVRIDKGHNPLNFETHTRILIVIDDEHGRQGEALVLSETSSREALVEGLLNLAAALER